MDRGEIARLVWAMTRPPVYREGISETAFRSLCQTVDDLQAAGPDVFKPPVESGVSSTIRLLACVVSDDVPDEQVPVVIARVVANPWLPVSAVTTILQGGWSQQSAGQHDVRTIREIGRRLRAGQRQRDIAQDLEVSRDTVKQISGFLGIREARTACMRDDAMDQLENGKPDTQGFAREYGVTTRTARKVFASVRRALGGVA